jgi:hypothetical protein
MRLVHEQMTAACDLQAAIDPAEVLPLRDSLPAFQQVLARA